MIQWARVRLHHMECYTTYWPIRRQKDFLLITYSQNNHILSNCEINLVCRQYSDANQNITYSIYCKKFGVLLIWKAKSNVSSIGPSSERNNKFL